jgi:hypothetical protein
MPYGAVFSGRVHRLENQQHRMAVGCVVKALMSSNVAPSIFAPTLGSPLASDLGAALASE